MANRKVLDGNIARDGRAQIELILKKNPLLTPTELCRQAEIATYTLSRFRAGENITSEQMDKIGKYIKKNKL